MCSFLFSSNYFEQIKRGGSEVMKVITGRNNGKTSRLIKESSEKWIYIICADYQRCRMICKQAGKMGLDIPFPITFRELPIQSPFIKSVLLDDAETLLARVIQSKVEIACFNIEDRYD